MEKITLRQLTEEIERDGRTIAVGDFDSMSDFLFYFDVHYKPLLKELQENWSGDKSRSGKRFFAQDILSLFGEDGED